MYSNGAGDVDLSPTTCSSLFEPVRDREREADSRVAGEGAAASEDAAIRALTVNDLQSSANKNNMKMENAVLASRAEAGEGRDKSMQEANFHPIKQTRHATLNPDSLVPTTPTPCFPKPAPCLDALLE